MSEVAMPEGFDLLEEKVRRAAQLVQRLRQENHALAEERGRLRGRVQEAEKALASAEKALSAAEKHRGPSAADGQKARDLADQVKSLNEEREEVRRRIVRLLEVLEAMET